MPDSSSSPHIDRASRRDHWFFTGLAVLASVMLFIGFAPTYFLKFRYGTPPLPAFLHVHGLLMTAWFVLLLAQVVLVSRGKVGPHRRLGVVGAAVAALIVVTTGISVVKGIPLFVAAGIDPAIVVVSFGTILQFAGFVCAAILCRSQPDAHKRLMLIATAVLLTASIGRWPIVRMLGLGPLIGLAVYSIAYLTFIGSMAVYDFVTRRRVHPALVWGGAALVVTQFLQEVAWRTELARAFARWLQG